MWGCYLSARSNKSCNSTFLCWVYHRVILYRGISSVYGILPVYIRETDAISGANGTALFSMDNASYQYTTTEINHNKHSIADLPTYVIRSKTLYNFQYDMVYTCNEYFLWQNNKTTHSFWHVLRGCCANTSQVGFCLPWYFKGVSK